MAFDFVRACSNFSKTVDAHNSKIFRKVVFDLYAEILKRSPVDTGLFRGNWRIGVQSMPQGVLERTAKGSGKNAAEISKVPQTVKENTVIYLVNNLVYALLLERGSSQQAPSGVVQPSMNAILAAMQGR